jgi:hypothetical protein
MRFRSTCFALATLVAAAAAAAQSDGPYAVAGVEDPWPIPTTQDDTCWFEFQINQQKYWKRLPAGGNQDHHFTEMMVNQVMKYCKPGDDLFVMQINWSFGSGLTYGHEHPIYSVAGTYCRRPEIVETKFALPFKESNFNQAIQWRCRIDRPKFDKLKERKARGERLYVWDVDYIEPRPMDNVGMDVTPQRRALGGARRPNR